MALQRARHQALGKETIDTYNTGESRGREQSHSLNYQKLGHDLASVDELQVMDGGKCILQLRGVRPFLSDKYDLTQHPNYKYTCQTCGNEWETLISTRSGGSACPYCSGIRFLSGFNDLATTHPDLAAEWSERNGNLKPDAVNALSRKNVWWKCSQCGHEWQSVIYTRANGGRCPVCEGREVKPGYNDLMTTDPEFCREWNHDMNGELLPSMVQRNSSKIVWWRGQCGHSWRGKIYDRVHYGQGCTKCDQAFREMLPYLMILYYSWEQGVKVILNESATIQEAPHHPRAAAGIRGAADRQKAGLQRLPGSEETEAGLPEGKAECRDLLR